MGRMAIHIPLVSYPMWPSSLTYKFSSSFVSSRVSFKDGNGSFFFRWLFYKALVLVWVFTESEAKMWLNRQSCLLVYMPWLENGKGTGKGWSTLSLGVRLIYVQTKGKKACVEVLYTLLDVQSKGLLVKSWKPLYHPVNGWGEFSQVWNMSLSFFV